MAAGPLTLSSTAFENEGEIPLRHAIPPFEVQIGGALFVCSGAVEGKDNTSPDFAWTNIPPEAKSLALIMVDDLHAVYPDAPEGTLFPHWTVYNIPPIEAGLPEGAPPVADLQNGTSQGLNGYPDPSSIGYGGPCPPVAETHVYIFTLYALDTLLDLSPGADYNQVLAAKEGHVLAQAELRGTFTGQ